MDTDIEQLVDRMDPDPQVRRAILHHLLQQLRARDGFVLLDDGRLVPEGEHE
jgi:hypothetical protein